MNQFDPTYGLEVLLIIALAVFSIIILTLMILLYAPRLRRKTTSTISAYSRESRTTSLDSDLESFYIPGPYAGYLKFQKSRNGRVYQEIAISKTLWHFSQGNDRALLVMAPGMGGGEGALV